MSAFNNSFNNVLRCGVTLACIVSLSLAAGSVSADNAKPSIRMESFGGLWQPATKITQLRTIDGKAPPLTANASKLYQAYEAAAAKNDRWFDTEEDCLPLGMTRMVAQSPFELVVDKDRVAMIFEWNRHVHFALRRATHEKEYDYPAYMGHTIAHMNGTQMVLDSTYFSSDTVLDYSGLPHSDQLHVVQSLLLQDQNTIVDTMTITDPAAFTSPWKTQVTLKRLPAGERIKEDVCVERKNLAVMNAHARRDKGLEALGLSDL
jgi:hypothetical protein